MHRAKGYSAQVDLSIRPARPDLVYLASRLEWLTAVWLVIEAVVAIGSGIAANSLSLIAFGADSLIELVSAGVLRSSPARA
jgi:hypothetical protein